MDETTMDVVPTEGGEQIAPQSEPSPEGAVQDSPGGESAIEALSQQVKSLSGIVSALQSDKDRRIPAIERELKAQAEQLESYHERRNTGMSHEEAMRADVLDQIVNERIKSTPRNVTVAPAGVPAEPRKVTVEEYLSPLLRMSGLKDTDPAVIEIVRTESDPARQMTAIANLAEKRKKAQETPANPAAVMSSGGGEASEGDTLESITAELNAELAKPSTPETRKRIKELGDKQRGLIPKG